MSFTCTTTNTHNHLNLTIICYKYCSICKCPPINCLFSEISCQKEGYEKFWKGTLIKARGYLYYCGKQNPFHTMLLKWVLWHYLVYGRLEELIMSPRKEGNFTSFFTLPKIYKYRTITLVNGSIVSRLHLKWLDRL